MDVSDIDLIRTLMETGSLSEATRHLGQSQPTLSRRLGRLEDTLGMALFHRSPRGLVPTEIARYIVAEAQPIETGLRAIRRHVALMAQMETGTLHIGVGPIIEKLLLPDALTAFIEATGDVRVSVRTEDDETLTALFERSELDVIIGPFDPQGWRARGFEARPMIRDSIIAVARPEHPLFTCVGPPLTPERVWSYPLIAPRTQGTVLPREGAPSIGPRRVACDNYDLLRRLTLRLDVICGGPRALFRRDLEDGTLRQIDIDLGLDWRSYLIVRKASLATPIVQHFVGICEALGRGPELTPAPCAPSSP